MLTLMEHFRRISTVADTRCVCVYVNKLSIHENISTVADTWCVSVYVNAIQLHFLQILTPGLDITLKRPIKSQFRPMSWKCPWWFNLSESVSMCKAPLPSPKISSFFLSRPTTQSWASEGVGTIFPLASTSLFAGRDRHFSRKCLPTWQQDELTHWDDVIRPPTSKVEARVGGRPNLIFSRNGLFFSTVQLQGIVFWSAVI